MPGRGKDTPRDCRIGITTGDPNGIGPEVALKAIAELLRNGLPIKPVLVGHASTWRDAAALLASDQHSADIRSMFVDIESMIVVPNGMPEPTIASAASAVKITASAGGASMRSIEMAVDLCLSGDLDAMVTSPISKEAIQLAGYDVPGHTEFIRDRVGANQVLMLMVSDGLRVAVATGHVPLAKVAATLSAAVLHEKLDVLLDSLHADFGIHQPRVAVLGLNPHAGDGGVLGSEEHQLIQPVIDDYRSRGADVNGPFPADGFFGNGRYKDYDGILAMYHDQGLVPFKTLSFNKGVNYSAGLPIVRTSPDHGTAFDIAGQGIASASSMVCAIETAAEIVEQRRTSTTRQA